MLAVIHKWTELDSRDKRRLCCYYVIQMKRDVREYQCYIITNICTLLNRDIKTFQLIFLAEVPTNGTLTIWLNYHILTWDFHDVVNEYSKWMQLARKSGQRYAIGNIWWMYDMTWQMCDKCMTWQMCDKCMTWHDIWQMCDTSKDLKGRLYCYSASWKCSIYGFRAQLNILHLSVVRILPFSNSKKKS